MIFSYAEGMGGFALDVLQDMGPLAFGFGVPMFLVTIYGVMALITWSLKALFGALTRVLGISRASRDTGEPPAAVVPDPGL